MKKVVEILRIFEDGGEHVIEWNVTEFFPMQVGNLIEITDTDGEIHTYIVKEIMYRFEIETDKMVMLCVVVRE